MKQLKIKPLYYFYENRLLWFRIFGYGLHIKDTTCNWVSLSERRGLNKNYHHIGRWSFRFLTPGDGLDTRSGYDGIPSEDL